MYSNCTFQNYLSYDPNHTVLYVLSSSTILVLLYGYQNYKGATDAIAPIQDPTSRHIYSSSSRERKKM